jgi:hypothetical protein
MALRVIGAGLGRTGTTSLKQALERLLGGPCYHMLEVQERPADADAWGDAYEGRSPAWENFFDGYQATVDWPAAPFWGEISRTFPDGLILLSVRDPDVWWRSVSSTIDAPADGWTRMGRGMMTTFSSGWQDEVSAKSAYLAHNEHVRTTAPKDRFLEWRPEDGWEPICSALRLGVPDEPFPRTNTTAQTREDLGLDPE